MAPFWIASLRSQRRMVMSQKVHVFASIAKQSSSIFKHDTVLDCFAALAKTDGNEPKGTRLCEHSEEIQFDFKHGAVLDCCARKDGPNITSRQVLTFVTGI